MKLLIGNKCYSSWSLRPWLVMRHFNIPFEDIIIPLGQGSIAPYVKHYACDSTGKVPCLIDEANALSVWESLAIIDYLADNYPQYPIWPKDKAARAHARAISTEMHAGFARLRKECPMNLGKRYASRERGEGVTEDVARIKQIWRAAREHFGEKAGGSFLYGDFCAADAMFAPVVTRFHTYSIAVDALSQSYMEAIMTLPAFMSWREDALKETWILAHNEFDEPVLETYRHL
jgi:glutathione S-transferase